MAAVETHRQTDSRGKLKPRPRGGLELNATGLSNRWHGIRDKFTWWEITLFIVGVVATCTVLSALFLAVGKQPARIFMRAAVPPVDSMEFSTALSNLVGAPVDEGGTVTLLNNGDEFFPVLLRAIDQAQHTINFSVYVWKDGVLSDTVLAALLKKQQQGVAVRILLDGFGSTKVSDSKFEALKQAGAAVEKYRTPKFGQLTRLHRRNHRRSIVIDGRIGFMGGMAVSDDWLGHAQDPSHWRDTMFEMTGPLATRLQAAFVDTWVSSSGEILVGPEIYPAPSISSPVGVKHFIPLANSPADDEQSMAYFFLVPVLAERHSIYLTTPYFIPDAHMKRALEEQAQAGVDVRLLLPGRHTDNWIARASAESRYDELIQAGVRIYEYQPTFIHAKSAVIDGQWSIIGSPNLDSRGRQLDEENAFGILDTALAARLQATFMQDLQQAKEIKLNEWRKRNPLQRAFETFSRVLDEQS